MGRNLLAAGFDLAIADILTSETLPLYRAGSPGCLVIHLSITLDAAHDRAKPRKVYITDDEFELLHGMTATPPPVDLVIDVSTMTLQEQIRSIRGAWESS